MKKRTTTVQVPRVSAEEEALAILDAKGRQILDVFWATGDKVALDAALGELMLEALGGAPGAVRDAGSGDMTIAQMVARCDADRAMAATGNEYGLSLTVSDTVDDCGFRVAVGIDEPDFSHLWPPDDGSN